MTNVHVSTDGDLLTIRVDLPAVAKALNTWGCELLDMSPGVGRSASAYSRLPSRLARIEKAVEGAAP